MVDAPLVYMPKKGDILDITMANFINLYYKQYKIKVLFIRLSTGVYLYGTKCVHIKV